MRLVELHETDPEQIAKLIQSDCGPFLREADGKLIYRGLKKQAEDFIKKTVRVDRKPKNTSAAVHHLIDEVFYKLFGIYGRSACVFVSGDQSEVNPYGRIHAVFPIGDFEFLWSPGVIDLFYQESEIEAHIHGLSDKNALAALTDYVEDSGYRTTDLPRAIHSGHEIMIQCSEYYALPIDTDLFKQVKDALK